MGHDIRAYEDRAMTRQVAALRLSPLEGFSPGNFYEVADAVRFRRSCSGTGEVAEFEFSDETMDDRGNPQTQKFLDELWQNTGGRVGGKVWVRFQ